MILITFQQYWPLLIYSDSYAIVKAFLAKPSATFLIVIIFTVFFATAHATEAILSLHVAFMVKQAILLNNMLIAAGAISVNIHKLASKTVPLATVLTTFGTLLLLFA